MIYKRKVKLQKRKKNIYEINDLLLKNNDYIFIYNFNVTSMFNKYVDIILGSQIETLGTFILNLKKKILKFSNKKKIILLDITINSCYVVPSLETWKMDLMWSLKIVNSQYKSCTITGKNLVGLSIKTNFAP